MDILIVVDMQYDFIDGSLGSKEAQKIVPFVKEKIDNFNGKIIFTQDTHDENYLSTLEGIKLPLSHCIKDTRGYEIHSLLNSKDYEVLKKSGFGSVEVIDILRDIENKSGISSITLVGLCTDVCVVTNALTIKTFFPNTKIIVDSKCCAGITKQGHNKALDTMKSCHIDII